MSKSRLSAAERGFARGLDQTFIATNLSELSESLGGYSKNIAALCNACSGVP
ncbi:hypothetical protein Thiosp_00846 [Thiorhodovibrio litoralis]|nr:hypothetical protein Thiosp_00846 [Thiorhodovibrio litoralis]